MSEKQLEKEFRKMANAHLIKPGKCKQLEQTRHSISVLHRLISDFRDKFNYVPVDARVLFNEYQVIQEKMLFESYKKTYYQV